jgi:hypothetical protein
MYAAKCDQSPFYNMELMLGQPQSKRQEKVGGEEFDVWVYPTMEVYVQNNQVVVWKETYVADPNALDKAAEAFKKADELDAKGAFKSKKNYHGRNQRFENDVLYQRSQRLSVSGL